MGRKQTIADDGIGPVLELLAKTVKAKHVKLQSISTKLGKAPTWLSGVINRKRHMYLDDFLDVCRVAEIDPVLMLATEGMMKYLINLELSEVVRAMVNEKLEQILEGQDITVRVPKKQKPEQESNGA